MKFTLVSILVASVASVVSAIDISALGERTVLNLILTPGCAQMCILNPNWVKTYAPECADIPLGIEYATKLCQNYMYQHMLDNCFKDKCNDGDRKKATILRRIHTDYRQENWGKTLVKVMECTPICLPGKIGFNILLSLRSNVSTQFFPSSFVVYHILCSPKSPSAISGSLYSQFV